MLNIPSSFLFPSDLVLLDKYYDILIEGCAWEVCQEVCLNGVVVIGQYSKMNGFSKFSVFVFLRMQMWKER